MAQVLVTGAAGFVGAAVIRHLRAAGRDAVAGTRRGGTLHGGPGTAIDVTDRASCDQAVRGMDAIIHCAVGDAAVTLGGTQTLLAAARAAGVRRVVHFSSIAVYGAADGTVTEDTPAPATLRGYAAWKQQAEAACGTETVRLRPSIIYGPGATLFIDKLLARMRAGRWGLFGADADGLCNPVHVDDVARAAYLALDADAGGQAFNIDAGTPLTWNAWFQHLADQAGLTLVDVPAGRIRAWCRAAVPAKALARVMPAFRPMLAHALLAPAGSECALYRLHATYPADRARATLGWQPLVPLETGIAQAVAACR